MILYINLKIHYKKIYIAQKITHKHKSMFYIKKTM